MTLLLLIALPVLVVILCVTIYRNGWATSHKTTQTFSPNQASVDDSDDIRSVSYYENPEDDVNPATGLSMDGGCVDGAGNLYGKSSH